MSYYYWNTININISLKNKAFYNANSDKLF